MNILREFRRVSNKSMPLRMILLLLFSLIFIVTTYAWFSTQTDVDLGGLQAPTTPWDVAYYINDDEKEYFKQTVIFTIDELYPGMPDREDLVHIYNLGSTSTNITYEIVSVKIFGQEVVEQLRTNGEIHTDTATNTTHIFSKDTAYPFNVSYTYDKAKLTGEYVDDATTPSAHATFKFNVNWEYEGNGTDDENLARDILDTKFGKDAYAYYQNEANDPTKAIEIQVKITSSMIHPSLENQ